MTHELQKKVEQAIKLIQSAGKIANEHGQPLEICYSGGKDSDVILELAKMSGVEYRAIYKNTTIDPAGTIAHAKRNGVEVVQPSINFLNLISKHGLPNRWRRFCCGYLKEYKILDYAVIGIRREESRARNERYKEPEQCRVYKNKDRQRQYFPILNWSAQDVADFISDRKIQCHKLYYDEQGKFHAERRLGCLCCPLLSKQKRIASFKQNPNMLRLWIKGASKYLETHPESKTSRLFNGNVYDWVTSVIYCDGEYQFRHSFGETMFGNDAIDTKAFLEERFNIKL